MILSDADAYREEAAREWQMCLHPDSLDPEHEACEDDAGMTDAEYFAWRDANDAKSRDEFE